jgi:3',5'-cyclic AMP phosphodiesterase CpdA
MFVLAHLSDPHLGPLPKPRLAELAGKRLLGFVNWRRRRHGFHLSDVCEALVHDLKAQAPDHVAVTGDLVNIAIEGEFAPARGWLGRLGSPDAVTVIPGNHDTYVRAALHRPTEHWGDHMRGDGVGLAAPADRPPHFPFLRRRAGVVLIGLSTAVPTAPFMATGRLGADQLQRFADALAHLRHTGLFRVVLMHHPPVSKASGRSKRLIDAGPFRQVLAEHGAELVIHGHDHVHSLAWLDGPAGRIPAVGVPSASAALHADHDPAAYNLYRIDGAPGAWRCEVISRGLRAGAAGIGELFRQPLAG